MLLRNLTLPKVKLLVSRRRQLTWRRTLFSEVPMWWRRLRVDAPRLEGRLCGGLHRRVVGVRTYTHHVGDVVVQPGKEPVVVFRVEAETLAGDLHVLVPELDAFAEGLKDGCEFG